MPGVSHTTIQILILILAVCGFYVAYYIRDHKVNKKPLMCPRRAPCDDVIKSDYSKIFGISVESLGLGYYALVGIYSLLGLYFPAIAKTIFLTLKFFALIAFIFSLYLVGVQFFILRKKCIWCLSSSLIAGLIFILTLL